jgi:hypothetical protein
MIIYDVTKKASFQEAEVWFERIKKANAHLVPGNL